MMHKVFILFLALLVIGCQEEQVPAPKPHAYPKVTYPKKEYVRFENKNCPFTFEYPAYAKMEKNTDFMGEPVPNDCWYDIVIPHFGAKIHLTYYPFNTRARYDELIQDAYRLTNEHTQKANFIDEAAVQKKDVFTGKIFDITGPAATPLEFYLTDNKHHFFRGALYLNTEINPDSLAPIYNFLRKDAIHLINTFAWK